MIGTALSAFAKIASSVYGGIQAKRAAEEGQQKLDKMKRENDGPLTPSATVTARQPAPLP